jgi:hypothetical protein
MVVGSRVGVADGLTFDERARRTVTPLQGGEFTILPAGTSG